MFQEMRRKDKKWDLSEAKELLKNGEYGVLSTAGENGYAYGVPLNYVYWNDSLYFHCATAGEKLRNINYNNKVSFCVVGKTCLLPEKFSINYESVVVFGSASEVFGEEKMAALLELVNKYSAEYREKGRDYIEKALTVVKVIKISVEHISGKAKR